MMGLWFWLALAPAVAARPGPPAWVPVRWEGGPLELARRAGDKAAAGVAIREAIARWYDPATLSLLDGTPVNCLLLALSAGADPQVERRQWKLVKEYARRAHARGIAVLGLVYPGAEPAAVASAAGNAKLDGIVLDGEFEGGLAIAGRVEQALRANRNPAVVIPIAPSPLARRAVGPVVGVEGVSPGVGKAADTTIASPTGGVWIDSNQWLVRSFRPGPERPLWVSHRPRAGSPGTYARSIADAAAASGRWIVTLDDDLRAGLLRREAGAMAAWRGIGADLAFFEGRPEWRSFAPFGNVGIVLDSQAPALANSEEYLNLVARRRIPYRVIDRAQLGPSSLTGLRAVLAFDLAPATAPERNVLRAFAAQGGLVLTGPSWGGAPKDQTYTIVAEGEGEIAVYRDDPPDPQTVARDLNDLVNTPELGVSVFKSPAVLSQVSASGGGAGMLIQLVNYATEASESTTVWITGDYSSARLYTPGGGTVELPLKRGGGRTEINVPSIVSFGAVWLRSGH
jgi:hypothetical protein